MSTSVICCRAYLRLRIMSSVSYNTKVQLCPRQSQPTRHYSSPPSDKSDLGKLIYAGTQNTIVKAVKAFSLSTSAISLAVQPFLFNHLLSQGATALPAVVVSGTLSVFLVFTPLLLHFITKRYVLRLYYDRQSDLFAAKTLSLFVIEQTLKFSRNEVQIPEVPIFFTTIVAKNKPLFVDTSECIDPEAIAYLMKYDKPADWLGTEARVKS